MSTPIVSKPSVRKQQLLLLTCPLITWLCCSPSRMSFLVPSLPHPRSLLANLLGCTVWSPSRPHQSLQLHQPQSVPRCPTSPALSHRGTVRQADCGSPDVNVLYTGPVISNITVPSHKGANAWGWSALPVDKLMPSSGGSGQCCTSCTVDSACQAWSYNMQQVTASQVFVGNHNETECRACVYCSPA